MCQELSKLKVENTPTRKWAKDMARHFTRKDGRLADRHAGGRSTSLDAGNRRLNRDETP